MGLKKTEVKKGKMIEMIITLISYFAVAVVISGLSAMVYAMHSIYYYSEKDKESIYIVGLIYAIAGIVLMVAC